MTTSHDDLSAEEQYHSEIESFQRRQQAKLASDVKYALIGRNAAIVGVILLLFIGLSRVASKEMDDIVMIGFSVGAMVFGAMFCVIIIAKLFRHFQRVYRQTADIIDAGIDFGKKSVKLMT